MYVSKKYFDYKEKVRFLLIVLILTNIYFDLLLILPFITITPIIYLMYFFILYLACILEVVHLDYK